MAWHWVKTKGRDFPEVWGGSSHWRADASGLVLKEMVREEVPESERRSKEPLKG